MAVYNSNLMRRSSALLLPLCFLSLACTTGGQVPSDVKNLLTPVAASPDLNGFLLNPKWNCQSANCYNGPGNPPDANAICNHSSTSVPPQCSETYLDIETPGWWTCYVLPSALHGHINLNYSTFVGRAAWWGRNDDFDYEFELTPPGGAALTAASPKTIAVEFSSIETFVAPDKLTPWWSEFLEWSTRTTNLGKNQENTAKLRARFAPTDDGRPNVVIVGILGIDCEHQCHSEMHPVYAFAVRANDPSAPAGVETWMLFARNWGNEGSCSHNEHPLPKTLKQLHLVIPNADALGFTASEKVFRRSLGSHATAWISPLPGQGAVVTFDNLSDPDDRDFIEGSVKFQWKTAAPPPVARLSVVALSKHDEWSESEISRWTKQLSPEGRQKFVENVIQPVAGKRQTEEMQVAVVTGHQVTEENNVDRIQAMNVHVGVAAEAPAVADPALFVPAEALRKQLCTAGRTLRAPNGEDICHPVTPAPK